MLSSVISLGIYQNKIWEQASLNSKKIEHLTFRCLKGKENWHELASAMRQTFDFYFNSTKFFGDRC